MRWISKTPPLYVWEDDEWLREPEYSLFKVDIKNNCWVRDDSEKVEFTKKTKIMRDMQDRSFYTTHKSVH